MWHPIFLLYRLFFSIIITCMINYFCWIWWYDISSLIFFFNCLIIDTNTWLYISLFLQRNECIKLTFGLNVDTRKVLISYNIIAVWCIWIILFTIVDMWVNNSTSPLFILVWNFLPIFPSRQRKHHDYLFYFYKILPQYNWN